ncbi:MAG: YfhO family protein, partial [Candidatus Nitrosotenuis sp.]
LFGLVLIAVILLQVGITLRYRSYNWIIDLKNLDIPSFNEMRFQKKERLDYLYYAGAGLQSSVVTVQLENSFMEPFLGRIFTEIIPVSSQEEAYKMMIKNRLPHQVFVEGYDAERGRSITEIARGMRNGKVRLIYSSYNRLEFKIHSDSPALFGLSYPYIGNWRAWVNGERTKVYRANGAAHVVEIPEGESIVEFRYWSDAFFWGMIVSCTTFTLIGVFIGIRWFRRTKRLFIVILAMGVGAGIFGLWYMSLYNGENLETRYEWTYTPPSEFPNLAYGKNVLSNSPKRLMEVKEMELYKGRLVDGDREPGSGFVTCFYQSPALTVDLMEKKKIERIVLYHSNRFPRFLDILFSCYSYPYSEKFELQEEPILDVLISPDEVKWEKVSSVILRKGYEGDIQINLQEPKFIRYVQVRLRDGGNLMLDEIEVY